MVPNLISIIVVSALTCSYGNTSIGTHPLVSVYSLVCSSLALWHCCVGIFPRLVRPGSECRALGSVCNGPPPIVGWSAVLWLRSEEGGGGREREMVMGGEGDGDGRRGEGERGEERERES